MNNIPSISIVTPAFNEEKNLERAVLDTMRTFDKLGLDYEVVIVNDASTDRTPEIADALARGNPKIRTLHHQRNQGIGGGLKTGIAHCTKDYVVLVPCDNPLDEQDVLAYLPRLGACDIVVGDRAERVGYSPLANFASFVYNRIFVPLLFNIGLSDVNWIQMYRRSIFSDGLIDFHSTNIFCLVEILALARKKRLILAEVPARMRKRLHGKATCTKPRVVIKTFIEMIALFLEMARKGKG
jgi:glycosyltransferase involved in cell wall biosynthesis